MNKPRRLSIRRAAVLGAGVMGAQIAALLAAARIEVLLYDLPADADDSRAIARGAIGGLARLEPAPLASPELAAAIEAADYEHDLSRLADCELVIEAIAERLNLKEALYRRIEPALAPTAILVSNTSGLSLAALAAALPPARRARFCGVHFFNPPRYMTLVELIATEHSDAALLDALETWLVSQLGKGVVRALDTPNFLANRIGVFSLLAVMHHGAACGLGFDEVDALTGPLIGRPKSASYRTADVVGLDTLVHVIDTLRATLPDDPWRALFQTPDWLAALVARGALGQKTRLGIYRKQGRTIEVLDPASGDYRPAAGQVDAGIIALLRQAAPERFAALRASEHPQARFLWAIFRDVFHYCAVQLEHIADNARDVDLALRWGFGWTQGPFEIWQAAGWAAVTAAIEADIAAGRTLCAAPLPAWVHAPGRDGVHHAGGSWSARTQRERPRSTLPVYARQLFPDRVLGEAAADTGETLLEQPGVRLWRLPRLDAGIGIVSLQSKMHAIGEEVLDGVLAALEVAEAELDGLVIWHEAPFAVGANLKQVAEACAAGEFARLAALADKFQRTTQALRYARVPSVAAVQGLALGGGCELLMHCTQRVLALESYIGLVEFGVGLIPAGGGCTRLAVQAAERAAATATATPEEVFAFVQPAFMQVAQGRVANSALDAVRMGYAQPGDIVAFNPHERLYLALKAARALSENGYRPPLPARAIPVAGITGIANIEMVLTNLQLGGQISAHDYRVAKAAASALCGGELDPGSRVDEAWLLALERRLFLELVQTAETQARIRHMLETGKPLRN